MKPHNALTLLVVGLFALTGCNELKRTGGDGREVEALSTVSRWERFDCR